MNYGFPPEETDKPTSTEQTDPIEPIEPTEQGVKNGRVNIGSP